MTMKLTYPTLVDQIEGRKSAARCEIGGRWYVAKPYDLPYYSLAHTLRRLFHVWLILRGKAMAVQFAQDRPVSALDPDMERTWRRRLADAG